MKVTKYEEQVGMVDSSSKKMEKQKARLEDWKLKDGRVSK
jgi:hypothetical protein